MNIEILAVAINRYRKMLKSSHSEDQSAVIWNYRSLIERQYKKLDTANQKKVLALADCRY